MTEGYGLYFYRFPEAQLKCMWSYNSLCNKNEPFGLTGLNVFAAVVVMTMKCHELRRSFQYY